jgi:1-acyl-sn-glycerol-3-phosphate acyltransferase
MSNERPKRPARPPAATIPAQGASPLKKSAAVKPTSRPATPVAASKKVAAKPASPQASRADAASASAKSGAAKPASAARTAAKPGPAATPARSALTQGVASVGPAPARRPGARRAATLPVSEPVREPVATESFVPAFPSAAAPPEPTVPAELVDAVEVGTASLRPPGILIDADDAETFADDIPQFAVELAAEDASALPVELPARAVRTELLPEQDVYANDYYARQWGRASLRGRSEHVDEFGLDPSVDARSRAGFETLFRRYFRAEVSGIEHVPASGRALLVANHSGTFPWDGVMLKTAIRLEHPARRELRWLTEDFVYHFPFLGTFLSRIGAVRANPENAERLLARDALVAVFPEGIQGIGKLYRQRYQLQRFGRGGYVKLALRSGAPLIPTAIVGAEETNPLLFKVGWLSKLTGLPYLPVTATFPWLGPLGLVPLPARWKVVFGPPIDLSEYGPEGADDAILVNRLNERVRATIQSLVDDAVAARGSVLFG